MGSMRETAIMKNMIESFQKKKKLFLSAAKWSRLGVISVFSLGSGHGFSHVP